MIYNPFTKIKELEDEIYRLDLRIINLKSDRDFKLNRISHQEKDIEDLQSIIAHWKRLAKFTFIAFSLSTIFTIYLLGTI